MTEEGTGATAGPEGGADEATMGADGARSEGSHNPFAAVRTRSVIPWMIFVTLILYAGLHLLSLLTPVDLGDASQAEVAGMVAGYGALAGWLLWVCRRSGVDIRRLVGRVPRGFNWVVMLLLLFAAMAFSLGSWFVFAYGLSVVSPGTLQFLLEALDTPRDPSMVYRLVMPIVVVIAAPLLEETAFRGVLLNRWAHKWGVGKALIATSVVFGCLHANPVGITAVGLVAAILYLRSGTLVVPMVFHGMNNLLATIGGYVLESEGPLDVATEIQEIQDTGVWGIVLVLASLPVLVWYIRRHWPGREAELPYASGS